MPSSSGGWKEQLRWTIMSEAAITIATMALSSFLTASCHGSIIFSDIFVGVAKIFYVWCWWLIHSFIHSSDKYWEPTMSQMLFCVQGKQYSANKAPPAFIVRAADIQVTYACVGIDLIREIHSLSWPHSGREWARNSVTDMTFQACSHWDDFPGAHNCMSYLLVLCFLYLSRSGWVSSIALWLLDVFFVPF